MSVLDESTIGSPRWALSPIHPLAGTPCVSDCCADCCVLRCRHPLYAVYSVAGTPYMLCTPLQAPLICCVLRCRHPLYAVYSVAGTPFMQSTRMEGKGVHVVLYMCCCTRVVVRILRYISLCMYSVLRTVCYTRVAYTHIVECFVFTCVAVHIL